MNKLSQLILAVLLCPFIFGVTACTDATAEEALIEARVFRNKNGSEMPYRILKPANYHPQVKYPLVLCLHGGGGRGIDNKSRGTKAFGVLSSPEVQKAHPAFILTPQCPKGKQWVNTPWGKGSYSMSHASISTEMALAVEILNSVKTEFSIDPARVYVTGQCMGGYGTWDIILRFPHLFAAAAPVCGAGDPSQAKSISHMPIWAFHGAKDNVVPPQGSRDMIQALRKAGSKVKYTEYPKVKHNSWNPAWSEEDLISWLFKHHKPDADDGK